MSERKTILQIDDDDYTLDLLELFLYNEYELLTARNGFEGLKTAEHNQPDLIITDIMMPVMDGIRFFNELRKRERTSTIPVIAVTSFVEQFTVRSLKNMGFDGVISKPLRRESLVDTVKAILGESEENPHKEE